MVLQQTLGKADSSIVTGERHSGKLTLVLTLLKQAGCSDPVLITPFEKETGRRKLDPIRHLATGFAGCLSFNVLYAKAGWRLRKREIGFNYLIDDLQRVIETVPGDAVVLHRMEEFFEVQDRLNIELFISAVTSATKAVGKKLFITLQHDEAHPLYLEQVERYVDLELLVERSSDDVDKRAVSVLYSSTPVEQPHFSLVRQAMGQFTVQAATDGVSTKAPEAGRVLLVTEDEGLANRLRYLLRPTGLSLKVVAANVQAIVGELISRPSLIILAAAEAEAVELMRIARDNRLKVLRISADRYVRKLDRLQAAQKGYLDLLPKDFYLEELVLSLERALQIPVYAPDSSAGPGEACYLDSKHSFFERLQDCVDDGLYFAVFSFHTPGICSLAQLQALSVRPCDMVCFDSDSQTLKFFAANLLGHNAAVVERKVKTVDPQAKLLAIQEACEFQPSGVVVAC